MALEVDKIPSVVVGRRVPEVVEADLHERRQRLEGCDVAAELGRDLVGPHDSHDRVPAHDRTQPALERGVSREAGLEVLRDRVDVRSVETAYRPRAGVLSTLDNPLQQVTSANGAVVGDDRVQRLQPLVGLHRVGIGSGAVRARWLHLN